MDDNKTYAESGGSASGNRQTRFFKTELHLHSRDASPCSNAPAKVVADKYVDAGYRTIVVTNHFSRMYMDAYDCTDWKSYIDLFVGAWEKVKYYAGDRLNVLLGAEFRYDGCENDYLVYGLTPKYLYDHPELLTGGAIRNLPKLREDGMMVFQAHPFRINMKIVLPDILDGYEAFNGHVGHQSSNDITYHWATKLGKPIISGSDHHKIDQPPTGGIITESEITTNEELIAVLRKGGYLLINAMLEHEKMKQPPLEFLARMEEGQLPPGGFKAERFTDDDIPKE